MAQADPFERGLVDAVAASIDGQGEPAQFAGGAEVQVILATMVLVGGFLDGQGALVGLGGDVQASGFGQIDRDDELVVVGAVDVASFGLRVALWSLRRPRPAPVISLDEPFKHLSDDMGETAIDMLKLISKRLGMQFIVSSHSPDLKAGADKGFSVVLNKKGKWRISEVSDA